MAALGPGSSELDYASVGVPFDERWPRFDEAVRTTRALLHGESFAGRFYAVDGPLEPLAAQSNGPPLWVGSWGSEAGLRRAVRLGDGWLASAYNIAPAQFAERWARAQELLGEAERDVGGFGNGIATMWFHVDERRADEVLENAAGPRGPPAEATSCGSVSPSGRPQAVLDKVGAFRDAGAQWMFLWPVADDVEQLQRFSESVITPLQA